MTIMNLDKVSALPENQDSKGQVLEKTTWNSECICIAKYLGVSELYTFLYRGENIAFWFVNPIKKVSAELSEKHGHSSKVVNVDFT